MVSLIQLEYIVELAKHQSFTHAAEHCFVTQPTLSMQIKKMEDDLGIILFDRTKKPVIPTAIGEIVLEQARLILAETAKIKDLVQFNQFTLSGKLRLGVIPSIAPYLLPQFIGKFSKKYPDLEISVRELLSEDIMKNLEKDELDVGLLATPLPRQGFTTTSLFYEQILIYCSQDHEFAQQSAIDIAQMKDKKIWLMSHGNCFRNQVINLCDLKESNVATNFHYESASIETLMKLVENEGGMTLIPELAAANMSAKKKSTVKAFQTINPVREVSLITNRVFIKKRIIEALEEGIKAAVATEMLDKNRGDIVEWN